jgi:hypothetical protein
MLSIDERDTVHVSLSFGMSGDSSAVVESPGSSLEGKIRFPLGSDIDGRDAVQLSRGGDAPVLGA